MHPNTLHFLKTLQKNNHREWFQEHKAQYDDIKRELESFVRILLPQMAVYEPMVRDIEPKKTIFRIYRDTRFSKDKTPYKTNIGAYISPSKAKDYAGYYLHIEPGNCFLAAGAYLPPPIWLQAIRKEIEYNSEEFFKIIQDKTFLKYFKQLEGEKLKLIPKGFDKEHPSIELLKHKSFICVHKISDAQIFEKDFVKQVAQVFKASKPLNDFLNRSLD